MSPLDPVSPQQLVERALEASSSPDCVAVVTDTSSANLRWANNTLTTNGVAHGVRLTVVAYAGDASASVSGTAATREQVEALVEAADSLARSAEPGEDAQPLLDGDPSPDWEAEPGQTSIEAYDTFAAALGEEFERAEAERRILYGFVDHEVTTTYLGSTTGLRLRHEQPTGHYACTAKPGDLGASAWVGGAVRDFTDPATAPDAHAVAQTLITRLGWAERRVALPAGRYDTVLPPTAVADLMIDAYWSAGARVAHEGQSVYSLPGGGTRIGERMVRPEVAMYSDPAYPGLECAPFVVSTSSGNASSVFDNGLALRRTEWIADGTLTSLLQTRHTAAMTGQPVTPAIDNLVVDAGGSGSIEDLVAGVERGLLLTCLWYIREVDPQSLLLTGLTRDGVYLVEGGEITGAVNNFRFNESPLDLLRRYSHASATVPSFSREWGDDYFSRTATPALRVPDFNMSSVSQAL